VRRDPQRVSARAAVPGRRRAQGNQGQVQQQAPQVLLGPVQGQGRREEQG